MNFIWQPSQRTKFKMATGAKCLQQAANRTQTGSRRWHPATICASLLILISLSISHPVQASSSKLDNSSHVITNSDALEAGKTLSGQLKARRAAWDLAQNGNMKLQQLAQHQQQQQHNLGPRFSLEPASLVEYSNSTGTVIACQPQQASAESSAGSTLATPITRENAPTPTTIRWWLVKSLANWNTENYDTPTADYDQPAKVTDNSEDQELVGDESQRFVRQDGALVISPFAMRDHRKEVHAATYRCCLENRFGSLCSRPVRTRAVIDSSLQPEVFDVFALSGNLGLLKCQVAAFMAKHVEYLDWLKDDKLLVGTSSRDSRNNAQLQRLREMRNNLGLDSTKYIMLPGGELYIRNLSKTTDQGAYRCRVRHRLTRELVVSKVAGQLMVDDSRAKFPLKATEGNNKSPKLIWAQENTETILCAHFQSQPPAHFRWFQSSVSGELTPVDFTNVPARQLDSCLIIGAVQLKHAGEFVCEASNGESAQRSYFRLVVSSAQLKANVQVLGVSSSKYSQELSSLSNGAGHSLQIMPLGSSLTLNCSINGWPFDTIAWFKDSKLIAKSKYPTTPNASPSKSSPSKFSNFIKLVQPNVITIEGFSLESRGLYQCQAYSSQPSQRWYLTANGSLDHELDGTTSASSSPLFGGQLASSLAQAERDFARSASAAIQLDVTFSKPVITSTFASQTLERDSPLSLQCSASGLPSPKIIWFLDGQPISGKLDYEPNIESANSQGNEWMFETDNVEGNFMAEHSSRLIRQEQEVISDDRFRVYRQQVSSRSGQPLVVSQLNVSRVQATETGLFKCLAVNSLGHAHHSEQVLVLLAGQPNNSFLQLRTYQPTNLTLIAGRTAILQCPLVGYPLGRVDWFKNGDQRLPHNHRQRIEPIRSGLGGHLQLSNLDKQADAGLYTCRATIAKAWPLNGTFEGSAGSGGRDDSQEATRKNNMESANEDYVQSGGQVGQLRVNVRVAPLIDLQSLPEVIQANEGMRTKLVCSIMQGDHPVEIRWLKRVAGDDGQRSTESNINNNNKPVLLGPNQLTGFELMQNSPGQEGDLTTIHNLEDSCQLTFKRVSYKDTGDYLCLAQNEVSLSARYTRLIVNVAPQWSIEPLGELSVLLGSRLQLDCSGHGYPSPSISWKRELGEKSKEAVGQVGSQQKEYLELVSNYRQRAYANGSLLIEQVEHSDGGVFMCEVSNGIGGGLSKLVRVSVNTPPYFKHRSSTHTAHLGAKAELKCLVFGDQPMVVGWQKESSEVIDLVNDSRHRIVTEHKLSPQAFESQLKIENLNRNDSGFYVCIGSNEFGTEETRVQLIVQEPPEAPILMRPIRATSRQATLSFRQPYSGNSLIKKYSISFKHQPTSDYGILESKSASAAVEASWQQILLDAPATTENQQRDFANMSYVSGALPNQLVHLNLCCLQPYTRYVVQVRALNDIGSSEPSMPVQLFTDEEAIGGPPLDVNVEPTGAHSLKVRWRAPARNLQNGLIRGFYIGYRASGSVSPNPSPTSVGSFGAASSSGLSVGSSSANVKIFENSESEQYQYKNVQLDVQQAPLGFRINNNNPTHLNASIPSSLFGQVTGNAPSSNSVQQDYFQATNHHFDNNRTSSQVFTSYLTNLRRKTAYSIIVQAYNKVGAGPRSDQIIISTLDAAPPMSPLLRLISVTYNSASLIWQARRFNMQSQQPQQQRPSFDTNSTSYKLPVGRLSSDGSLTTIALDEEAESAHANEDDDNDPQSYYTINFKVDDKQAAAGQQLTSSGSQMAPDAWQQRRVQRRHQLPYVLNNLRCGSRYLAFMTATNSLGQSEPGQSIRFTTLGGAPIAPSNSRQFLQVNSTFVLLRLGSWLNAGCVISSFTLKYRAASQAKWTILEHQVHPTIQTVTISGSALFSTRASSESGSSLMSFSSLEGGDFMDRSGLLENARRAQHFNSQLLMPTGSGGAPESGRQQIDDFIIRNLFSGTPYRLVVEASSESGSTIAEYELETGNFSSSTVSIIVNGNVEILDTDQANSLTNNKLRKAQVGFEFAGSEGNSMAENIDFSYGGGQQRTSYYNLANGRYNLSLWSMSALLVVGSAFMILTTIVVGVRSLIRIKSAPSLSNSRDSLLSAIFCCSASSSSRSSTGADDSSHSSSGGTCYQTSTQPNLSNIYGCLGHQHGLVLSSGDGTSQHETPTTLRRPAANTISGHLNLTEPTCDHSELKNMMAASSLPFRQLVSSSSLSTIHAPSLRFNNAHRHLASNTLGRRLSNEDGEPGSSPPNLQATARHQDHIRAHYAATLGKHPNSSFLQNSQPVKFGPSLYGRLSQANQQLGLKNDQLTNNYQMFQHAMSSSSGTSGYETSQRANSDADCQPGVVYLQNSDNNAYQMNMYGNAGVNGPLAAGIAESNLFELNNQQQAVTYGNEQQEAISGTQNQFHYNNPNQLDGDELAKQVCQQQQQLVAAAVAAEQLSSGAYGMIFGQQQQANNNQQIMKGSEQANSIEQQRHLELNQQLQQILNSSGANQQA